MLNELHLSLSTLNVQKNSVRKRAYCVRIKIHHNVGSVEVRDEYSSTIMK